ncbi:sensor domain-containing diguanylate cyclase [Paenibacillus segetis]|uniref:GGDEF domain-containing protein n=1 Tax=Paenibacillus segetis TaxID=1325360 RepID=A0ABQ1YIK0_9BACL|nr:diguanylate cyclase [Paenibacillus segetis]GGH25818.1 hypothetical protein GCM10008013_26340 [Paenibacillus segetis]
MAKHSRDDLKNKMYTELSFPPLNVWGDDEAQMNWLEQLDITPYDYPYTEALLKASYEDWKKQASDLSQHDGVKWFITNHLGEILNQEYEPELITGVERQLVSTSIRECLEKQSSAIIKSATGIWIATPIVTRDHSELFALMGCYMDGEPSQAAQMLVKAAAQHFRSCFYKRFENLFVSDLLNIQKQAKREENRRSMLFQVVQRLHDKIDVDSVITEVFERIAGMYPAGKLELLMSQDHPSRDPRVKSLQLQGQEQEDYMCVRAFMEGRMLRKEYTNKDGEPIIEIAVPLIGKQGVYGVFHLTLQQEGIEDIDLQLIGMLADTAGTAFENAKLYEQSNLLISELRLINELTKRLNQSLKLKEVFKFATDELLSIFQAEFCCITQIDQESDIFEIVSCNVPSLSKEIFPKDYGFCGLVFSTREPIILSDYKAYGKVTSRLMDETESRSMIAAPLIVGGEVNGAIILAHRNERFFSYENYKLLQVLASHIGLAISNASLHAEVRKMANRDMLTGLYARHYLDDAIQNYQKKDVNGSLIIVDIDQFKQVNDTFGHQTGDKILKQVCAIVKSSIRKSDVPARWGGEELAIYLPGADVENCYQIAETIRLRVAMETDPPVTVSCGVSEWREYDDKVSVESLFYQADMALYKSKNNGRNQTQIGN